MASSSKLDTSYKQAIWCQEIIFNHFQIINNYCDCRKQIFVVIFMKSNFTISILFPKHKDHIHIIILPQTLELYTVFQS